MLALLPTWLDPAKIIHDHGNAGVWIVLAIIFAECGLFVGFVLPGDSLLFLAGFFSAKGDLWAWYFLLPALFIAAFAGDQLGYFIGSRIGPPLFDRPDARIFKQKYVRMAHEYLEERGAVAIPLSRFVPVVRTFMPIVVGVSEIRYRRYVMLDAIGALCWAVGVTTLGLILEHFVSATINIDKYIYPVVAVVVVLSLVPAVLEFRASKRREAAKAGAGADAEA